MPDTTPLPLPECPREDCPATINHWHDASGASYACARQIGESCLCHVGGERHITRCYAPRTQPAPQPPAVALPTVDEVAEAIRLESIQSGFYSDYARAVLDLIAARVPVWQPVEWEAIRPGMLIRGTRPGYRFELTVESIDRHAVRGVGGSVWMRAADGGGASTAWQVDPRTVPAEPAADLVETIAQAILRYDTEGVVEWERCSGQGTYRGEARAVLDAIRAEWTIEPKAVQS